MEHDKIILLVGASLASWSKIPSAHKPEEHTHNTPTSHHKGANVKFRAADGGALLPIIKSCEGPWESHSLLLDIIKPFVDSGCDTMHMGVHPFISP